MTMKEVYEEAKTEIIEFECADVITTSGDSTPIAPLDMSGRFNGPVE